LYIFDIGDRSNPIEIGHIDTPLSAAGILVRDNIAYVAAHRYMLRLINISDPSIPLEIGFYEGSGFARRGLAVLGEYALVPAWNNGLQIIDISNPESPQLVSIYQTPGFCHDIYAKDYAYIANYTAGIQVLDISDPANPGWVGEYDTPGFSRAISVEGEYIFVADSSSMQILHLEPQTDMDEGPQYLPDSHLLIGGYPNPFNSSTLINCTIPKAGRVEVNVYNVLGEKVAELCGGYKPAGSFSFPWNPGELASGIYFAKIASNGQTQSVKLELMR